MLLAEGNGLRVHAVDAGRLRLDGGAMFGVVPKPLWSRKIPADERNRIPMAMRCLLVETPEARVLVDTGAGRIEDEKFREIYGIENEGTPTRLEDSLRALGVEPAEIDVVACTHLHFDHAGGNTRRDEDGELVPAFPRARYLIRRGELEIARSDNRRIRASYLREHFEPLLAHGVVDLVDEDREIVPGVRLASTPGHTADHQSVLVELGGETVFFPADLVPTSAHVRLAWIMAYDLDPLTTLAEKERWLGRAARERWRIVFEHDPRVVAARARPTGTGVGCDLEDPVLETEAGAGASGRGDGTDDAREATRRTTNG